MGADKITEKMSDEVSFLYCPMEGLAFRDMLICLYRMDFRMLLFVADDKGMRFSVSNHDKSIHARWELDADRCMWCEYEGAEEFRFIVDMEKLYAVLTKMKVPKAKSIMLRKDKGRAELAIMTGNMPERPRIGQYTGKSIVPLHETTEVPEGPPKFPSERPMFALRATWFIDELDGQSSHKSDILLKLHNTGIVAGVEGAPGDNLTGLLSDIDKEIESLGQIVVSQNFFMHIKNLKKSVPATSVAQFSVAGDPDSPILRIVFQLGTFSTLKLFLADISKDR